MVKRIAWPLSGSSGTTSTPIGTATSLPGGAAFGTVHLPMFDPEWDSGKAESESLFEQVGMGTGPHKENGFVRTSTLQPIDQ